MSGLIFQPTTSTSLHEVKSIRSVEMAIPFVDDIRQEKTWMRLVYYSSGFVFLALAGMGALLPVLPTTPFLILASGCFYRSSPEWRTWLLRLPVWGPVLLHWETHRAVKPRTKVAAVVMILLAVTFSSLAIGANSPLFFLQLCIACVGLSVVWQIPITRPPLLTGRMPRTLPVMSPNTELSTISASKH